MFQREFESRSWCQEKSEQRHLRGKTQKQFCCLWCRDEETYHVHKHMVLTEVPQLLTLVTHSLQPKSIQAVRSPGQRLVYGCCRIAPLCHEPRCRGNFPGLNFQYFFFTGQPSVAFFEKVPPGGQLLRNTESPIFLALRLSVSQQIAYWQLFGLNNRTDM